MSQSKRMALLALGLSITAVIAVTSVILVLLGQGQSTTATPGTALRATATLSSPTPLPVSKVDLVPTKYLTPGWTAGPVWATSVALVPGMPDLVYVCGAADAKALTLQIGLSQNGGKTWYVHPLPSTITGINCGITVNPLQPGDMVITLVHPFDGPIVGPLPFDAWRSLDNGQTFTKLALPDTTGSAELYSGLTWIDSTLYGVMHLNQQLRLIASKDRGNFQVLGADISFSFERLSTMGTALLAQQHCQTPCNPSYISRDQGVTWENIKPNVCASVNSTFDATFSISSSTFDGKTVLGGCEAYHGAQPIGQVFRSTDGAKTWKPFLTTKPISYITVTPTGDIYGLLDATPPITEHSLVTLAVLSAGTSDPRPILQAAIPLNVGYYDAYSLVFDAKGRPVGIWDTVYLSITNTWGLEYHTLP